MKKRLLAISWLAIVVLISFGATCGALFWYSLPAGIVASAVWFITAMMTVVIFARYQRWLKRVLMHLTDALHPRYRERLSTYPMPIAAFNDAGDLLYYNERFRQEVLGGNDALGYSLEKLFDGVTVDRLRLHTKLDVACSGRHLSMYIQPLEQARDSAYVLYFHDNTQLQAIAAEYTASRPVALLVCIDNLEEATQHLREGERTRIAGQVESILDEWISPSGGILRKFSSERFMVVIENRHLNVMTKERFPILDTVRTAFADIKITLTLSIGVGQGRTMQECEQLARQALEMALARGGDQVAIKTENGYDFYGGRSHGVERRTKVRTRVMADSLKDLISTSDHVFVMGHRLSDLDCLGSAVALAVASRRIGTPAHVVVNRESTMAAELIRRYETDAECDLFICPTDALEILTENSLLIVTDTHTAAMLDSPALYEKAKRVALIDHHRKMANCITDLSLEYHESSTSSACELVTELLPYMGKDLIGRQEAEALLSGIMLDTRNFVLRTGVRTFEAAAYLRRLGADTVSVKRMFADSLEMYQKKSALVTDAKVYRRVAIAVTDEDYSTVRAAAAQAADELLTVNDILASFVVCRMGEEINISARSYGGFNVQLVMEALGGGGHLTMAGAQLRGVTAMQAEQQLVTKIDEYMQLNGL